MRIVNENESHKNYDLDMAIFYVREKCSFSTWHDFAFCNSNIFLKYYLVADLKKIVIIKVNFHLNTLKLVLILK